MRSLRLVDFDWAKDTIEGRGNAPRLRGFFSGSGPFPSTTQKFIKLNASVEG